MGVTPRATSASASSSGLREKTVRTTERPALREHLGVEVAYWSSVRVHTDGSEVPTDSFASLLGPFVVELVLASAGPELSSAGREAGGRLLAPGTHLRNAAAGSTVWGVGTGTEESAPDSGRGELDVRSVRGPWTAAHLTSHGHAVPAVYGDPVLLLSRFLPDVPDVGGAARLRLFVPDREEAPKWLRRTDELAAHGLALMSPTAPLLLMLSAIARAELVVGSSVQAVAVADAYGVPARLVRSAGDRELEQRDYLLGTGRPGTAIAADVAHALEIGGHEAPEFDAEQLLAAFPWDLWGVDRPVRAGVVAPFSAAPSVLARWQERVTQGFDVARLVKELSADAQRVLGGKTASDPEIDVLLGLRRLVLPDVPRNQFDRPVRDLLYAIDHGAPGAAVRALVERGPGDAAQLVAWRDLGRQGLASVDVSLSRAVGPVTRMVLELSGRTAAVVQDIRLFEVNHDQTELNLHVLLPFTGLAGSDELILRIVDEDGERVVEVDTGAVMTRRARQEVNA